MTLGRPLAAGTTADGDGPHAGDGAAAPLPAPPRGRPPPRVGHARLGRGARWTVWPRCVGFRHPPLSFIPFFPARAFLFLSPFPYLPTSPFSVLRLSSLHPLAILFFWVLCLNGSPFDQASNFCPWNASPWWHADHWNIRTSGGAAGLPAKAPADRFRGRLPRNPSPGLPRLPVEHRRPIPGPSKSVPLILSTINRFGPLAIIRPPIA